MIEVSGLTRGEPKTCMARLHTIQSARRQVQIMLSQTEVYHINKVTENMIELSNASRIVKEFDAETVTPLASTVGIRLDQFDSDVVEGMKNGRFSTVLKSGHILLAIDNEVRMRASLLKTIGAAGAFFYESNMFADVALARAMHDFQKPVTITFHMTNGIGIALWTSTGAKYYEDMTVLKEWNDNSFSLGTWKAMPQEQLVEFEHNEVNGYVPVVCYKQSIVGNGNFHCEYGIRERDTALTTILPVETFDEAKKAALKKITEKPIMSETLKKMLGQKKTAAYQKLIDKTFDESGADAAMKVMLRIPEQAATVARRFEFSKELGRIYMES